MTSDSQPTSQIDERTLLLILGNQLFPPAELDDYSDARVFMAEDVGLCTYVKHHQLKIVLFLAAMREYRDELAGRGFDVHYDQLDGPNGSLSFEEKLTQFIEANDIRRLVCIEIEDHFFEARIQSLAEELGVELTVLPSPMFLTSREAFGEYCKGVKRPFMATFYQQQRKRLKLLVDDDENPVGGQWSFDSENRKPLPGLVPIPDRPTMGESAHVEAVKQLVADRFADHPGDVADFWMPVTRRQALLWFRRFLEDHFEQFGDYEDALSSREPFLFHSVLTPALNLGLITPREVVDRAIAYADEHDIPINSLEGFVRQVIGWREFIRGIYHEYDAKQQSTNFWKHKRKLTNHWWDGTTGLPPLDDVIAKALKFGWTHHIERLMVAGNLMLLCEIQPKQAYDWFMSMYVDSSDWVMGPNVYGMALFSDGGIFATKPYICGSNYIIKMSDYGKGDWCDVMDGLYWRFIGKHRDFFESNPRLSMMSRMYGKMKSERRKRLLNAAEQFLKRVTKS